MGAYVKFNSFVKKLGTKVFNLDTDTIGVYLSNTAPNPATATVKADVPEIATGNGYAGPIDINNAYTESGGVGTMTSDPAVTITASGGAVGPFRYAILCDLTVAGNPLCGYSDYGSPYTIPDGGTFTINFEASVLTVQ